MVVRRAGEAEKAEYDPRARSSIITSFVPRYAKLYIVYIQGWWVGKQKPYGSKMEKFDVVGRSSRCSQSTDKHPHIEVKITVIFKGKLKLAKGLLVYLIVIVVFYKILNCLNFNFIACLLKNPK